MPCALCKSDAPLRQSHIVPEFIHRPVYDVRHRTMVIGINHPTKLIQKGVREPLLCDECEARFQRYEHYFSVLWYRESCLPTLKPDTFFKLEGLDYRRFKLFILSIVWRAAVSRAPEFAGVSLGPHEERLRLMLVSGDPKSIDDYPLIGGLVVDPETGRLWDRAMLAPMCIRVDGHNAVRMFLAGVSWTVLVTSHAAPKLGPLFLQPEGTIMMPVTAWQEHADAAGLIELCRQVEVPDLR